MRPHTDSFSLGTDLTTMAARAREMGLDAKADQLIQERDAQLNEQESKEGGVILRGDHIRIQLLLKRVGSNIDDDEEMIIAEGHNHGLIKDLNFFETITAIFKSTVGTAVLYIPMGFVHSGFAFAIPMLIISYTMVAWSSSNLLVTND
jgi:hypothetical protein